MLGLRTDIDTSTRILTGVTHVKSFKFAERNTGRFHTSGISGSMKKHTIKTQKSSMSGADGDQNSEGGQNGGHKKTGGLANRLATRQREIEEDTKNLIELETKLENLKLQKKLKLERQELRARQRVEYLSSTRIQAWYRSYLSRRRCLAVTILHTALKAFAHQQALTAAFWAAKTISRFSSKVGRDFRRRKQRNALIRYLTTSSWLTIKSTAMERILFRTELAQSIVTQVLHVGIRAISRCITKAKQLKLKRQNSKLPKAGAASLSPTSSSSFKQLSRFSSPNKSPVNTSIKSSKRKSSLSLHGLIHFHLRSFRCKTSFCDSWYNPATDMDYTMQAMTQGLASSKFHHHRHHDTLEKDERDYYLIGKEQTEEFNRKGGTRVEVNEPDERARRLALLHKQREEEMELERQKRIQYIEEQKKLREKEFYLKQQAELKEKERQERLKQEFFVRILTEQTERAKLMRQKRIEKEKLRQVKEEFEQKEHEKQKFETKLMFLEDSRREELLEKQRKKILQFRNVPSPTVSSTVSSTVLQGDKLKRPGSASTSVTTSGTSSAIAIAASTAVVTSTVRRKLMSHIHKNDGTETQNDRMKVEESEELPRIPIRVIKKPIPVQLTKEEEEKLKLEKEELEREKLKQQELYDLALRKRLAAKLTQQKEEKERAIQAEEEKKKEQELLQWKASLLIKKDLHRKEEAVKELKQQREKEKELKRRQKGLRKGIHGTSSADSSHLFPSDKDRGEGRGRGRDGIGDVQEGGRRRGKEDTDREGETVRLRGSAPGNMNPLCSTWESVLLDPLDSSTQIKQRRQHTDKAASDWDWNTGINERDKERAGDGDGAGYGGKSELHINAIHDEDYDQTLNVQGDHQEEDYNFSENFLLQNSLENSVVTPLITLPSLSVASSTSTIQFPPLGSGNQHHHQQQQHTLPPPSSSSLSISFAHMISSNSRPNPFGGSNSHIPSSVERVLKRKTSKLKAKEAKKLVQVVTLADMLLRAKEKLAINKEDTSPPPIHLDQDTEKGNKTEKASELEQIAATQPLTIHKKTSMKSKSSTSTATALEFINPLTESFSLPKASSIKTEKKKARQGKESDIKMKKNNKKTREGRTEQDGDGGRDGNRDEEVKEGRKAKRKEMIPLTRQKKTEKSVGNVSSGGSGGVKQRENEVDEGDTVVENYFQMKRRKEKLLQLQTQIDKEQEEEGGGGEDGDGVEYLPASPMFPSPLNDPYASFAVETETERERELKRERHRETTRETEKGRSREGECYPLDLPHRLPSSSSSLIDPTPLDLLSYFNPNPTGLLDHRSHSIIEESEEEEEEKDMNDVDRDENDSDSQQSYGGGYHQGSYIIHEDEEDEESEEEGDESEEVRVREGDGEGEEKCQIGQEGYEEDWEGDEIVDINLNQRDEPSESLSPHHGERDQDRDDRDREDVSASEEDMSVSVKESSDEYENLLNLECEKLRKRLEEKMSQSQSILENDGEGGSDDGEDEGESEGDEEGDEYGNDDGDGDEDYEEEGGEEDEEEENEYKNDYEDR